MSRITSAPMSIPLQHSFKLQAYIRKQIMQAGGEITFAEFMRLALYLPKLGYYSAGLHKFGADGDFITGPELSPLFSQCVAVQCQQVITALKEPDILEFGAGSGTMAVEILRYLHSKKCLPNHYYIVELSANLRARQQQAIKQLDSEVAERVVWLDQLPSEPINGIMLANEVLDAMPVHRFIIDNKKKYEAAVCWDEESFNWKLAAIHDSALQEQVNAIVQNYLPNVTDYASEINLLLQPWLASLADCLGQGVILLIDYGFPRHEYYHPERNQGTLMCHYRHHAHGDPFFHPGLQDLTAHVDFTACAQAGEQFGLQLAGYCTQAYFLLSCGIMDRLPEDPVEEFRAKQAIKMLTLPHEMGELFKVMALSRHFDSSLMGFQLQDLRYRL